MVSITFFAEPLTSDSVALSQWTLVQQPELETQNWSCRPKVRVNRLQLKLHNLIMPRSGQASETFKSQLKYRMSGISKPMVCQTYGLGAGRLSRKRRKSRNGENDEDNSDSYKQGVECWIRGNHGNHENDENHRNRSVHFGPFRSILGGFWRVLRCLVGSGWGRGGVGARGSVLEIPEHSPETQR